MTYQMQHTCKCELGTQNKKTGSGCWRQNPFNAYDCRV